MSKKNVKRPNTLLYRLFGLLFVLYAKCIGQRVVYSKNGVRSKEAKKEVKALKPPYILIANHSFFLDFTLLATAQYPRRINFIVARKYFEYPILPFFLKIGQTIPKSLFQTDSQTIRLAFSVLAQGGILGLYPEGQIAIQGTANKPPESIAKLVKRAGVPVLAAKTTGAYLVKPTWAKYDRRGPVYTEFTLILSAEESRCLPLEEIERRTFAGINVDNFAAQRESGAMYKGKKRAEGLENILYLCPFCHAEFTLQTEGNYLKCANCGLTCEYGEDAHFHFCENAQYFMMKKNKTPLPAHVGEWYDLQRKHEINHTSDKHFACHMATAVKEGGQTGNGILTFTRSGYQYRGTPSDRDFPASAFQYAPYDAGSNFQFYYQNKRYDFYPEDPRLNAKAAILTEALFALQQREREQNPAPETASFGIS